MLKICDGDAKIVLSVADPGPTTIRAPQLKKSLL